MHQDQVVAISAPPCYVVGANNEAALAAAAAIVLGLSR